MLTAISNKVIIFFNKNTERMLGVISPLLYLSCIMGTNYIFTLYISDEIYGEYLNAKLLAQVLIWFMSLEMMINWIFLCTVRSPYQNSHENSNKRDNFERENPQFVSVGIDYEQLQEKSKTLGNIHWSVTTHYKGSDVTRIAYPYWAWKPCIVCSCFKPPRCHHCPICKSCILKRDHHCFFALQCVGLFNQRFFVVFNFWSVMLISFALPQYIYYIKTSLLPEIPTMDLVLPWTIISWCIGWTNGYILAVVYELWLMSYFIMLAGFFLYEQIKCLETGLTSFELDHPDHRFETTYKSRYEKYATVFGRKHIWLNFLIPLHCLYQPTDDGITWCSIKMD